MAKVIYLIRHAEAASRQAGSLDAERLLTKRGEENAALMGNRLFERNVFPGIIVSSPAKRALKTAQIISNKLKYPENKILIDELIYDGYEKDILNIIKKINDTHDCLFVCGHNPTITSLSNEFSNIKIDNIPTCGIFSVEFDTTSWKDIAFKTGKFLNFDYPAKVF